LRALIAVLAQNSGELVNEFTSIPCLGPYMRVISKGNRKGAAMQTLYTETHISSMLRRVLDSNAIAIWISGFGMLTAILALPAFV
jgi:hypothetical protein